MRVSVPPLAFRAEATDRKSEILDPKCDMLLIPDVAVGAGEAMRFDVIVMSRSDKNTTGSARDSPV
jgi:hypothetical protein